MFGIPELFKDYPYIAWPLSTLATILGVTLSSVTIRNKVLDNKNKKLEIALKEQGIENLPASLIALDSLKQKVDYLTHLRDCLAVTVKSLTCSTSKDISYIKKQKELLVNRIINIPPIIMSKKDGDKLRLALFQPVKEGKQTYLKIVTGSKFSEEGKSKFRLKLDEGFAGYAFSNQRAIYDNNVKKSTYFKEHEKMRNFSSLLCVPIIVNGQSKAVISIEAHAKDAFEETDIIYMEALAEIASIIYETSNCKAIDKAGD